MDSVAVEKAIWRSEGDEKRSSVREMFGRIAPVYDRMNALMSLSRHRAWRTTAIREIGVKPGESALDICCGTGDFLAPLGAAVGFTGKVAGLDYCAPMLQIARQKSPKTPLMLGDACALPFASESFDILTVGWGLRNLADLKKGLFEAVRVLRPGGRFASLDMAIPRNPLVRFGSGFVSGALLPALGRAFGNREAYTYLPKSAERFLTPEQLQIALQEAGLTQIQSRRFMLGNICLVWGVKP